MVDFQKSFIKGIEAHDEATRARREISSVFDEFARQIHGASGGRIQIRRDASQRADKARRPPPTPSPEGGSPPETAVSFGTIFAGAPYTERYEICSYQLSRLGYPVTITFGGNDYRNQDKAALEECLSDLLQDPLTGGKLRRLMGTEGGLPEAQPDPAAAQEEAQGGGSS
jgi:hypothetical protein